jgi:autophagy-related protein 11
MAERHTHGRAGVRGGTGGRGGVASGIEGVSKTLSKSLESRRSSTGSKKALPFAMGVARGRDSAVASETNSLRAAPADTPGATSPTQQHAVAHGVPHPESLQETVHAAETARASANGERSTDAGRGQQPPQPHSEVRSNLDTLMGP